MNYACPNCNSDHIQKLSVIYSDGHSDVNTSSAATVIGSAGINVGSVSTTGTMQTLASLNASPPKRKPFLKPLLWLVFVLILATYAVPGKNQITHAAIGFLFCASIVGWLVYACYYNYRKLPSLKKVWNNAFRCNRCGQEFLLAQQK